LPGAERKGVRDFLLRFPAFMTELLGPKYTFKRTERIHLQKDFAKTLKFGRRLVHPAILIFVYCRKDSKHVRRLGLITSRKLGSAVLRNRLKRRLREIFRLNKHTFKPGLDIIMRPKDRCAGLKFSDLNIIVLSLLKKAGAFETK
jgi:ribonuclease P protein component